MDNTGMKTLQLFVIFLQVIFAIGTYCYLYPPRDTTDHQFLFMKQSTLGSVLSTSSLHELNPFHYLISEIIVGLMLHLLDILIQICSIEDT
jgi:preprotein translocase subunit SecY